MAHQRKKDRKRRSHPENIWRKISCFKPTRTFYIRKIRSRFPALRLPDLFSPRGEVEHVGMKLHKQQHYSLLKYTALCPVSHRSMCKLNKNNTARQLTTAVYFISLKAQDSSFSQIRFTISCLLPEAHQITLQNTQKVKKKKWQHKNSQIRSEEENILKSGFSGLKLFKAPCSQCRGPGF